MLSPSSLSAIDFDFGIMTLGGFPAMLWPTCNGLRTKEHYVQNSYPACRHRRQYTHKNDRRMQFKR